MGGKNKERGRVEDVVGGWMHMHGTHAHIFGEEIYQRFIFRKFGYKNLRKMNLSLLCKWWWRLETEDGMWQDIIKYKYLRIKSIHEVSHCLNDSQMWYDMLKIKDIYICKEDPSPFRMGEG